MIPKYLRFKGLTSYKDEQIIDFDKLINSDIVLINGKTGSGKTTVLDAITCALYGKSSSGKGNFKDLRCKNKSDEDIETEIEFIFEIKGNVYKFFRRAYSRIKRTNTIEEVLEHNASFLENGEFIPFFENSKGDAVDKKAKELIGLDFEQFLQVIVLPQGKFEKFLIAPSSEKESILKTLFHTDDWEEIGKWLFYQGEEINKANKLKQAKMQQVLADLKCETFQDIAEKKQQLELSEEEINIETKKLREGISAENKQLDEIKKLSQQFEKRKEFAAKLENLEKQNAYMSEIQKRLDSAEKAKSVQPSYDAFLSKTKELAVRQAAKRELDTEKESLIKRDGELEISAKSMAAAEPKAVEKREKLIIWESSEKHFVNMEKAKTEQKTAAFQEENLRKQQSVQVENEKFLTEQKNAFLSQREEILSVFQSRIDNFKAEKAKLEESEKQSKLLENTLAAFKKYTLSREEISEELKKLLLQKNQAEKEYDEAYSQNLKLLAQNLSATLVEGEPCPVCGSAHHPKSAENGNGKNLDDELKSQKERLGEIDKKIAEKSIEKSNFDARIDECKFKISELEIQLSGLPKFDADKLAQAADFVRTAEEKINSLPQLNAKIAESEKLSAEASSKVKEISDNLALATLAAAAATEKLKISLEQLPSGFSNLEELKTAILQTKEKIAKFDKQKQALTLEIQQIKQALSASCAKAENAESEALRCDAEQQAAEKNFLFELEKSGLKSVEEFKNSALTIERVQQLLLELDSFKTEKSFCEKTLSDLEVELSGKAAPDVKTKEEEISALNLKLEKLTGEIAVIKEEVLRLGIKHVEYQRNSEELQQSQQDAARLSAFGKKIRGDTGIGLKRYVLGIMFENVLAEANRLLTGIKGGQFRLRLNSKGKESGKYGLDLLIESNKTEEPYDVKALSGGEKFLVAISLSLALSAVVQMQAGGVSIDSMFIDEGFGTLDPSTLDEALDVLRQVKGSKRFLGIISHVEILKESIPTQIKVTNDSNGSRLAVIC